MILTEIKSWIISSGCISYAALCQYAKAERPDWMPVIRKKTISISKLLQISRRRTKKKAPQQAGLFDFTEEIIFFVLQKVYHLPLMRSINEQQKKSLISPATVFRNASPSKSVETSNIQKPIEVVYRVFQHILEEIFIFCILQFYFLKKTEHFVNQF